jgi:hypothetical protein
MWQELQDELQQRRHAQSQGKGGNLPAPAQPLPTVPGTISQAGLLGYQVNVNVPGTRHHRGYRPGPGLKPGPSGRDSEDDLAGVHAPGELKQRGGHIFAADGVENAPEVACQLMQ